MHRFGDLATSIALLIDPKTKGLRETKTDLVLPYSTFFILFLFLKLNSLLYLKRIGLGGLCLLDVLPDPEAEGRPLHLHTVQVHEHTVLPSEK